MIGELVSEGRIEFFSEQVDSASRQLVVEKVQNEVLRDFDFDVHVDDVGFVVEAVDVDDDGC